MLVIFRIGKSNYNFITVIQTSSPSSYFILIINSYIRPKKESHLYLT
jgi:hypothetical protein